MDKAFLQILNNMKYNELCKKLRKAGCFPLRHGGRHDIWQNPTNGACAAIPRHGAEEVKIYTLKAIYRQLGL